MGKPKRDPALNALLAAGRSKKKRKEKGSGTKKYDRNRLKCQRYRNQGRRELNKARRQAKIAKRLARRAERRQVVDADG